MSTTINWPSSLPQFVLRDGYNRSPRSNVIRTEMDTGPAKVRRRSTFKTFTLNVTMAMDVTELNTFESFFDSNLGYGALSFNFPNPEDPDNTIEVRFNSENETMYSITPESSTTYFIVEMTLEII